MSSVGVEKRTGQARNGASHGNNTTILGPNNPWKDKMPSVGEMRQNRGNSVIIPTAPAAFLRLKNDLKSWGRRSLEKDIQGWNAPAYQWVDVFSPCLPGQ